MTTSEIEDFAAGILRKHHNDVIRSLQYLEHCIQSCNNSNNYQRRDEFAEVRDYIAQHYI